MIIGLFLIYIILLPVMKPMQMPVFGDKIRYSDFIFAALFIIWLVSLLRKKIEIQKVPFLGMLCVILTAFILSFKNSINLTGSSIELAGFIYVIILYFIINQVCVKRAVYWNALKVWTAVSLAVALIGICGYLAFAIFKINSPFIAYYNEYESTGAGLTHRLISTFSHPSMLASYLHVSLILAFAAKDAVNIKFKKRYLAGVVIIFLIAVFLTRSRLAGGMLVSLFLISVWWRKKAVSKVLLPVFFWITIILLLFSILSAVWWILPATCKLDMAGGKLEIGFNTVKSTYYFLYKSAWDIFKDHPVFGVGLGNFNFWVTKYIDWKHAAESYRIMIPGITEYYKIGQDPHSTYFGLLSETGFIGFAAVLGFFTAFIVKLFKLLREKAVASGSKYVLWCFLSGIIGFLLNALYIEVLTMRHFWVLLAMAAVYMKIQHDANARNLWDSN